MKKKQMLLVMLVSLLALSFTFLGCGDEEETTQGSTQGSAQGLNGTWVYGYTKAEFAEEYGMSEAEFDALLAQYGVTINFPIQMMKITFTSDKDFIWYSNESDEFFSTPDWEEVIRGTYTVSGNSVTLNAVEDGEAVSLTCTLNGNTLTMSFEGQTRVFQKQ